nr:dTDP-glucose 4,6-dehydratase [Candidatus Sigynarchaeota archaeon]
MKTIMVTGGCGFIGSCFIRLLLSDTNKYRVINVDRLTYAGNLANVEPYSLDDRLVFERADVADAKKIAAFFKKYTIDVVVHFAAETHVDRSIKDASPFIRTNVVGTQVLLDACRAHGVERFVQVSTDEVYGALDEGEPAFTEESPVKPTNPYAASKAASDLLVNAYHHTYGVPCIITRCSNDYGPYQFPEKFIPVVILNAMDTKQIPVYGTGQNIRDWIFVEDHCRGIRIAMENGRPGEVYNFGGNSLKKNIDVVKQILGILGKPETLITLVEDRPGHDFKYAMNFQKATKNLGWMPSRSFDDGLLTTVAWYREHAGWIEAIKSGAYLNSYRDYMNRRKQR